MHLLHRGGRDGAVDDRNADVLQTVSAYGCRLIEGPRLHRVAIVEHDLAARGLEGSELLLGWLTAGNPARNGLGGIWKTGKRVEQRRHLGKPSTSKPSALEPADNVRIPPHHAPHEIGAEVLDHRQNRSLIDAEVIDVEPAERRIYRTRLLLASRGERGIEGIEEAVSREEVISVRGAHREQRGDRELGRTRRRAAHGRRAERAVVALVAERRAAGGVRMELAAAAGEREGLVRGAVACGQSPEVAGVADPGARVRDRVRAL